MIYNQEMYQLEKQLLKEIEQEKKLSLKKISRMIALGSILNER